jgi:hypothetical protein
MQQQRVLLHPLTQAKPSDPKHGWAGHSSLKTPFNKPHEEMPMNTIAKLTNLLLQQPVSEKSST